MPDTRLTVDLTRNDLLEMEGLLCESLSNCFSFTGHALYFPTANAPDGPVLLPRERRLLLPLQWRNSQLGVFMANGVRTRELTPLRSLLPGMAKLCLEKLAYAKAMRTDPITGLFTEPTLYAEIEAAAAGVRDFLETPEGPARPMSSFPELFMGLVVVRIVNADQLLREGFGFHDAALRELAAAARSVLPSDVTAARSGPDEFALLLPAGGRMACHELAGEILKAMSKVLLVGQSAAHIPLSLCAGHAVYPQDLHGSSMALSMYEQSRRFMSRARLAADVASRTAELGGARPVMAYAHIVREGGRVLFREAPGRYVISLGRQTGAREGQRFAVQDDEDGDIAELFVIEVRDRESLAELMHVADPARLPAQGDGLVLLEGDWDAAGEKAAQDGKDGADASVQGAEGEEGSPERLSLGSFFRRVAEEQGRCRAFVLAVVRMDEAGRHVDAMPAWMRRMPSTAGTLVGEYGSNGLAFFHPETDVSRLLPVYRALHGDLEEAGLGCAIGLAGFPFLHLTRDEMRECVVKALECAMLLEGTRVAPFDSLAINIHADRLYSQGDVLGAIDEYKLALLADDRNAMAWNSLGICMAVLGKHTEAKRHFLKALACADATLAGQVQYNLGTVCQRIGHVRAAFNHYRACLAASPGHLFAHVRLGQLHERSGRRNKAREHYEKASELEGSYPAHAGIGARLLARLAVSRRGGEEARELLHEALRRNPQDPVAMLMLAERYLEGGEDPSIVEILARRSLSLWDRPEGWMMLAKALKALGKEKEADKARERAESPA
ncbi:MAG: diguanylate cyclase [Desulfovibrio sp.]|jgi:tetratricopeptide (TPR) repeat protein/GGDEF domain-containing protein|nr:diguanylate cyclase [Desulfovibrio sp.]